MTKEVQYSNGVQELTQAEANDVIAAAQSWHDPDNGNRVNSVALTFDPRGQGSYGVQVDIQIDDVDPNQVQTAMDDLAQAVASLPGDWGVGEEIKDRMRVR